MAYFANGSEGEVLDNQCAHCKLYMGCPIAFAQIDHNYEAQKNEIAKDILNILINDETKLCELFRLNRKLLYTKESTLNS